MNTASGFIILHRKLLEWEWHDNPNTLSLFIHLLLGANHEDNIKNGIEIKRGECLTSLPKLARLTGQTEKQVRVSLEHLKTAGTVADRSTNRYRIITVLKYDDYQDKGRQKGRQRADKRADKWQAEGQQYNNNNNINNKTNKTSIGGFTPPTLTEVTEYFKEIGSQVDPGKFYDHYVSCGWILKGGQKMKDWQATARNWDRREKNGEQKPGTGNPGVYKKNDGTGRPDYSFLRDSVIQV